jgi:chorismate--pyruvate lyase
LINSTSSWRSRLLGVRGAERAWLTDPGSLTRRIQSRCPRFAVRHVQQQRAAAALDEARLCGLKPACATTLREVYLYCHDTPVVFAHSVLPAASLRGSWQGLGKLGSRPLGGALFANPLVQRTPLQYSRLSPRHRLYQRACAQLSQRPPCLWARRSLFTLRGRSILVTEVFLPGILELS